MDRLLVATIIAGSLTLTAGAASAADLELARERFAQRYPGAVFVAERTGESVRMVKGFVAPLAGDIVDAAADLVLEHAALFGVAGAGSAIELERVVPHRQARYVRFAQSVNGLPVFGARVIVHVDAGRRAIKVSSSAVPLAPATAVPALDERDAELAATRDLAGADPARAVELGYLRFAGELRLAYRVVTAAPGPHLWASFVDAEHGGLLARLDGVQRHAALVYEENPVVSEELTAVTLENIVDAGVHADHTYGAFARVASCTSFNADDGCTAWTQRAVADSVDGFTGIAPELLDNVYDEAFPEVQTYYAVDKLNRWFRDEFGFDGTFADFEVYADTEELEQRDYIWVIVNATYENGFYSGGSFFSPGADVITLGHIGGNDLGYDNDVSMHEFGHAVAAKEFNIGMGALDELGIDTTSGGISEGNADYFAVSTHGNPTLGEWASVGRNADNENVCPLDLIGESHHDGQIVVGALWEIWQEIGKAKTDHLHYGALASSSTDTFTDYGEALLAQAEAMAADDSDPDLQLTADEVAFVAQVVEERNLVDCERLVPLVEGADPLLMYVPWAFFEPGMPSPVEYEVTVGPDTQVIEVGITNLGQAAYDVMVRAGEPVIYEWSGAFPNMTWDAEFDHEWAYSGSAIKSVKLSDLTDPPLAQDTVYYFSISCRTGGAGCVNYLTLTTSDVPEGATGDDAGLAADAGVDAGGGGKDDSGCGCRAAGRSASGGGLLGLLVALLG